MASVLVPTLLNECVRGKTSSGAGDGIVTPTQRLLIGAFVAVGSAGGFALGRVLFRPVTRVNQPIVFNHQIHAGELEIPCDLCHEYYATSEHSGLPLLTTCMDCHEEPLTESIEEQKIRDLAENGDISSD